MLGQSGDSVGILFGRLSDNVGARGHMLDDVETMGRDSRYDWR